MRSRKKGHHMLNNSGSTCQNHEHWTEKDPPSSSLLLCDESPLLSDISIETCSFSSSSSSSPMGSSLSMSQTGEDQDEDLHSMNESDEPMELEWHTPEKSPGHQNNKCSSSPPPPQALASYSSCSASSHSSTSTCPPRSQSHVPGLCHLPHTASTGAIDCPPRPGQKRRSECGADDNDGSDNSGDRMLATSSTSWQQLSEPANDDDDDDGDDGSRRYGHNQARTSAKRRKFDLQIKSISITRDGTAHHSNSIDDPLPTPVSGEIDGMFNNVTISAPCRENLEERETPPLPHIFASVSQKPTNSSDNDLAFVAEDVMELLFSRESHECTRQTSLNTTLPRDFLDRDRTVLGEWMIDVGDDLGIQPSTTHTAIQFLDRFIAAHPTTLKSMYQLVAICSVGLACKMDEADFSLDFGEMSAYTNSQYNKCHVKQMERVMLNTLQWELTAVTPSHFLPYFIQFSFSAQALTDNQIRANLHTLFFSCDDNPVIIMPHYDDAHLKSYIENLSQFLVDKCAERKELVDLHKPSQIAAAAIVAARYVLNISDIFPSQLANASRCEWREIVSVVQYFTRVYRVESAHFMERFYPQTMQLSPSAEIAQNGS